MPGRYQEALDNSYGWYRDLMQTILPFQSFNDLYSKYGARANVLYIGDQAAYEKYAAMAQDKKVCQRVDAPDSAGFWGCFQEMQQKGTK